MLCQSSTQNWSNWVKTLLRNLVRDTTYWLVTAFSLSCVAENESTPPKSDETTLQQRLRFQEVIHIQLRTLYDYCVIQRLRKLASQNKALSGYEALRTRILEQVMDLFK